MVLLTLHKVGYVGLAGIVFGQGVGLPIPGGISLIAAGALAAQGHLNLVVVCLIGIVATVTGSNLGYLIGRRYGTEFLKAPGPLAKKRHHLLKKGHPIVEKYGWLAVLFARFIPVLREGAPIIAGSLIMNWKIFAIWNAIGGVEWVLEHVLLGYFLGSAAEHAPGVVIFILAKYAIISLVIATISLRIRHKNELAENK